MKLYNKIKGNLQLFWHSLFRGMAAADTVIKAPVGSENSSEIVQQMKTGGVFDDMLQQKETQRVKETRDKYYRILREADKWDASNITIVSEDENGVVFGNTNSVRKKTKQDFMKHSNVYNPENLLIRTIQDNKQIQNLFTMTPYYYKTPFEAKERLKKLESLKTKISFLIKVYRKI